MAAIVGKGKTLETNPRGIPKAPFIEDVEAHLGGPDEDTDRALKALKEMLAKYRFMESNMMQRRKGFEEKVPELEQTLQIVKLLKDNKQCESTLESTFELTETLYAHAEVQPLDEIFLWLGANVMLSYSLSAACELLNSKLETARLSLGAVREDLDWLREQITVTEVNVARVYNWDVKRRRARS